MQTRCHLSQLPYEQARKYGDRVAFVYHDFGKALWKEMSWKVFAEDVRRVSNALLNLGVRVQENIGVFSQNSIQYICTDFGAYGIRAVTIPFYATSSEEQIQFVINDVLECVIFHVIEMHVSISIDIEIHLVVQTHPMVIDSYQRKLRKDIID